MQIYVELKLPSVGTPWSSHNSRTHNVPPFCDIAFPDDYPGLCPGKPRDFGISGFRVDHRLRLVAFLFEIFVGGFNGHPGAKLEKWKIDNSFFEQKLALRVDGSI